MSDLKHVLAPGISSSFPRQFNLAPRRLFLRPGEAIWACDFGRATRAADTFATVSPKRSPLLKFWSPHLLTVTAA
jgi:hypothetical protein